MNYPKGTLFALRLHTGDMKDTEECVECGLSEDDAKSSIDSDFIGFYRTNDEAELAGEQWMKVVSNELMEDETCSWEILPIKPKEAFMKEIQEEDKQAKNFYQAQAKIEAEHAEIYEQQQRDLIKRDIAIKEGLTFIQLFSGLNYMQQR